MHLYMEFSDGVIKGEGTDHVGPWTAAGSYDESKAAWVKQYVNQHSVKYEGSIGHQGIQGIWDIRGVLSGPFHIWPTSMNQMNELYLKEDLEQESSRGTQLLGTVPVNDPFV